MRDEDIDIARDKIKPKDKIVYTENPVLLNEASATDEGVVYLDANIPSLPGAIGGLATVVAPGLAGAVQANPFFGRVMKFAVDNQEVLKVIATKAAEEVGKRMGGKQKPKDGGGANQSPKGKSGKGNGGGSTIRVDSSYSEPGKNNLASNAFTNVTPTTISVTTPLSSRILCEDLAVAKKYEPSMHIVGARFALQVNENDAAVYKWFDEVVVPDFQNLASLSVNYGINAESVFSTSNLLEYINGLAYALQVYYFYLSIIAYENNIPHNKNAGMKELRKGITQANMYELEALSRTLRSLPIPPRLNEICFFIQQPFKLRPNAFGSICKFMPFGFNANTGIPRAWGLFDTSTSIVQNAIDNLMTPSVGAMTTKLANIVPEWLDVSLFAPGPMPVYNPTLSNIWANSPTYQEKCVKITSSDPTVYKLQRTMFPCYQTTFDDKNSDLYYLSYDDVPDSIAFAMFGGFMNTLESEVDSISPPATGYSNLRPGLLGPENSAYYVSSTGDFKSSNVFTWFKSSDGNITGWEPMSEGDKKGVRRTDVGRSCYIDGYAQQTYPEVLARPCGTNVVSYTSIENARYTAKQLVEYIMDLETMKIKAQNAIKKRQPYNSKGTKLKTS